MAAKKQMAAKLDPGLVEAIRNAAWWVGRGISLNSVLEAGTMAEIARLEKEYNGGAPFEAEIPATGLERPKQGRPMRKGLPPKTTISFRLYDEDQARLRRTALALGISMTEIMEAGAQRELDALQKQYNRGKPFQPRDGDLPHTAKEGK